MAVKKNSVNLTGKPGDYTYGILNSIERPIIGKAVPSHGSDPWSMLSVVASEFYKVDALKNTGPYRGIVLRVESGPEKKAKTAEQGGALFDDPDDATHYIYNNETVGGDPPELVRIKVRVPELHAHIKAPENWGDVDGDHQLVIDLHPTYVAQTDLVPQPAIGDIVWVDYTNKNDFTDPIYIRPVTEKQHFIELIEGIVSKYAFLNCNKTTAAINMPGIKISDTVPSVNYAANQNYPKGTRTVPPGEITEILEAGESEGIQAPESEISPILAKIAKDAGIVIKAWVGRAAGNGYRNVIVMMPKTTNLDNPFELIYHFHGHASWFSGGTPKHILENMKTLSEQKRNFVLVYPQMPWGGNQKSPNSFLYSSKVNGINDREPGVFLGPPAGTSKGGSFQALNDQVLTVIKEVLKGASQSDESTMQIGFLTVTCHSRGGIALAMIAATGGFMEVKPDKITLGDADYGYGGPPGEYRRTEKTHFNTFTNKDRNRYYNSEFPQELLDPDTQPYGELTPSIRPTDVVWEYYVKGAKKLVEYNLLVISPERRGDSHTESLATFPRAAAQELISRRIGKAVPSSNQKRFVEEYEDGTTASINYVPLNKSHSKIGSEDTIIYAGSREDLPVDNDSGKEINPEDEIPIGGGVGVGYGDGGDEGFLDGENASFEEAPPPEDETEG